MLLARKDGKRVKLYSRPGNDPRPSVFRQRIFCRSIVLAMRPVRDLILVICAVISTACLVYMAIHLDTMQADNSTPETSVAPQ